MDESERMVALKKAYAEIILNTAKEMAARVMASERRALRSQHDLNAAKDEALRLLIRLKKMIDAKETEGEINAIGQRRKIEELEAHLQEAEDKILDLRAELRNVSDEVEKKKNEMQLFSGGIAKEDAVDPKDEMPENHLNNLEPIVPYSSDSEVEIVVTSAATNKAFSRRIQEHNSLGATKQAGLIAVSPLRNYLSHSSKRASIIMRSAEPELCRNGYMLSNRTFEERHADVRVAAGEVGNECISAIGGLKSKASEKSGTEFTPTVQRVSSLTNGKELLQEEIKKPKLQIRQRGKSRLGMSKSSFCRSYSCHLVRCSQSSFVPNCNLANGNTKGGEDVPSDLSSVDGKQDMEEDPAWLQEKLHSNCNPPTESKVLKGKRKRKVVKRKSLATSLRPTDGQHRTSLVDANVKRERVCLDISIDEVEMGSPQSLEPLLMLSKNTEDSAAVIDMSTMVKERKLKNESHLVQQESDAAEVSDFPLYGLDPEDIDGPVRNSKMTETDIIHDKKGPSEAKDSKILKYTFHRKRKKDLSNSPGEGASPEKGHLKKLAMDTEDVVQEYKSSSVESSRNSRRQAQVARQLISLSGKRL